MLKKKRKWSEPMDEFSQPFGLGNHKAIDCKPANRKIEIPKDGDVSKPGFKESMISQPDIFKKRVKLLDVDNFYSSDVIKLSMQ